MSHLRVGIMSAGQQWLCQLRAVLSLLLSRTPFHQPTLASAPVQISPFWKFWPRWIGSEPEKLVPTWNQKEVSVNSDTIRGRVMLYIWNKFLCALWNVSSWWLILDDKLVTRHHQSSKNTEWIRFKNQILFGGKELSLHWKTKESHLSFNISGIWTKVLKAQTVYSRDQFTVQSLQRCSWLARRSIHHNEQCDELWVGRQLRIVSAAVVTPTGWSGSCVGGYSGWRPPGWTAPWSSLYSGEGSRW